MKEKSFFGGTAYLGIPFNEKYKQLVFEGIDRYGINYGASRNNNVSPDVFCTAEAEAAKRCGAEASIILSSGYLAAQLVIQHHFQKCKFIYAPDTHPALWIGKPNPPRMSFGEWAVQAVEEINGSDEAVLLISNSLNNLIPEIYDFNWLKKIIPGKKVTLLVDDSHGIGITGEKGEGVYSWIPKIPHTEIIVIASMAKALGVDAGVILGTNKSIKKFRTSPVYAGASPPVPGVLYAYVNALSIYQEELKKLRDNIKFFTSLIKHRPEVLYITNFPVFLIDDAHAVTDFASKGIQISSFAYPDPTGKVLNRVVLNSGHNKVELKGLAEAILGSKEQGAKNKDRKRTDK
ncbi:aminotransferase class I/II-fold pyridoxal phosphate-dependent enzyme [Daejeonella sp.]|uniref:aminotransferase class I/II-fold pyridoxal phosphate-dependent enzyme n=1 Tax=Daejeonella sp. TaxID=2805397 RepID=UPI003983C090